MRLMRIHTTANLLDWRLRSPAPPRPARFLKPRQSSPASRAPQRPAPPLTPVLSAGSGQAGPWPSHCPIVGRMAVRKPDKRAESRDRVPGGSHSHRGASPTCVIQIINRQGERRGHAVTNNQHQNTRATSSQDSLFRSESFVFVGK